MPLAAENERLVKENNQLHMQLIQYREQADGSELKWKASYRQTQNEVQDLRFLLTQKDQQIAKIDQDNVKLRTKLDSVMEKLYMPSQDQIVGGLNSEGKIHNILKGQQQQFELNQNFASGNENDLDIGAGEGESSLQNSSPGGIGRSR